jgi:hypothetical protein
MFAVLCFRPASIGRFDFVDGGGDTRYGAVSFGAGAGIACPESFFTVGAIGVTLVVSFARTVSANTNNNPVIPIIRAGAGIFISMARRRSLRLLLHMRFSLVAPGEHHLERRHDQ